MRKITLLLSMLVLSVLLYAQQPTVGTVRDEKGEPIPFATVTEVGKRNAVQANEAGVFRITVARGAQLRITASGQQPQTVTVTGPTVDVRLSSNGALSEVVVTAAGGIKVRQKEQGYNATVVKADAITAGKAVNVASGLQGKVAGLVINSTSSGVNPNYRVVLRGMRSLTGNNEALIVLDNVIVPNSILGNINPEDVADVTVLNGSSASALYGSDASNGALIITTKKGSRGPLTIRVQQTKTLEQVAFYPKLNKSFGSGSNNDVQVYLPYENQQYGPRFDGVVRPIGLPIADGSIQQVPYSYTNSKEKFWETGQTDQTDISFSSGSERSTIYFAGQYATTTGTTPGDKYNRGVLSLRGSSTLANPLSLTYSASYTQNRYDITTQTSNIYNYLLNAPSQAPLTSYKDWRNNPFANPNGYFNEYYNNPYFMADNYRQLTRNDYFVGSTELKYTPLRWLDFTGRVGVSTRNQSASTYSDIFNFSAYTIANTQGSYKKANIVGGVTEDASYTTRLNGDFLVGIRKTLNDFNFRLTLGASLRQDESKNVSTSVSGLVIPGLFNLGNSTNTPTSSGAKYKARQAGTYGDLTVGFKNYLFLHLTGRNDWVSTLAEENRTFFYPSADISFIVSDAVPAIKNIKAIDQLKLRGGVSKVGQVNIVGTTFNAYGLIPTFSQGAGYPYNGQGGFSLDNRAISPNLTPEITKGYEFGFDATLLDQKVLAKFTYYSTKTKDQTVATGISSATGFSSLLTNTGLTSSRGIESSLQVTAVRTRNFEITLGGNYTYNDNRVESISSDLSRLTLGAYSSGAGAYAVAGQPFPVLMGTTHRRDPQGRIIVNRITGYPSATDTISILGNAAPKHILGLTINLRYKGLTFSALGEYRGGYYIYNAGGGTFDFSGAGYNTVMYDRERFVIPNSSYEDPSKPGVYVPNTNVTVRDGGPGYWTIAGPRTGIAENYITSGAFWKLREMSLAYDLPGSLFSRTKAIKGARISVQGRNLFIWLPKTNVYTDPEYSDGNGSSSGNAIGLTNLGQTPPSRYYGATLSLTF